MVSKDEYTIGWICPLELEYTAALMMLDEEHEALHEQPAVDDNIYSLGRVAGHKVVIASLPVMGNQAAATVATQMRNTFPGVRYVLLVGIGGGVPARTDAGLIRLGDVVVSKPTNGHSGALQYDRGKAQRGHFRRAAALAAPPRRLLNAAGDLAAKRARQRDDPVAAHMTRFDPRIPGLRRFRFPGRAKDRLFEADYEHRDPRRSCVAAACDARRLVPRGHPDAVEADARPGDGLTPPKVVVHRGTIASGELVIKNGVLRDQLAAQYDVLCFEMEAAGILAGSDCLVIRGIADYCDSHKNDEWQGYAAAAAACYARQLLFHLPHIIPRPITAALGPSAPRALDQERPIILDWLTTIDYGPQLNDLLSIKQQGTHQWFLQCDEFQRWLRSPGQTLYCTGMPGAGKTIVAATAIDCLLEIHGDHADVGIAYIFCNAKRKHGQTPLALFLSLLKQIAQTKAQLPEVVVHLYRAFQVRGTKPSLESIVEVLQALVGELSAAYIVVDGLDECQSSQGDYRPFLASLVGLQQTASANILVTSRYNRDIETSFAKAPRVDIRAKDVDIERYLDFHLLHLSAVIRRDRGLQETIKRSIIKASDGMFLLAKLLLGSLSDRTSKNSVLKALGTLPDGSHALATAYEEAMERISNQRPGFRDLAMRVLGWIVHARRPLTTRELQHALAIDVSASDIDADDIEEADDMVSVCAGLVAVDKESQIIRLVHYTAQEYLWNSRHAWFADAENNITRACLHYLSLEPFSHGSYLTVAEMQSQIEAYPLLHYAAQFWGEHAALADFDQYRTVAINHLTDKSRLCFIGQVMHVPHGAYSLDDLTFPREMTSLHIASSFDLKSLVEELIDNGANLDEPDSNGWTALHRAAENGNIKVTQVLLSRGAYVDQLARLGGTPLHRAATNGHSHVVARLLSHGALVDLEDNYGGTALHRAAKSGHVEVARLLLRHGADPDKKYNVGLIQHIKLEFIDRMNAVSRRYYPRRNVWRTEEKDLNKLRELYTGTALHQAVKLGHPEMTKLLLEAKADPFCLTTLDETPLHLAAETGNETILQLLLSGEAAILPDSKTAVDRTPLSLAAGNGHAGVVRSLLKSAGVNWRHGYGLSWAAKGGHDRVVNMFLDNDINIEKNLDYGETCLSIAVKSGNLNIFNTFLERHLIRPGETDERGHTAFAYAAKFGHFDIFDRWFDPITFDPHSRYSRGRTLFSLAAEGGSVAIARSLLPLYPLHINAEDEKGKSPLHWASNQGHTEMVRFLLHIARAHPDTRDRNGSSPLMEAATQGHTAIVTLLLETNQVEVDARNADGETALWLAVQEGNEDPVNLLLQTGRADPNHKIDEQDLLAVASEREHRIIIESLLQAGQTNASPYVLDRLLGLALQWDSEVILYSIFNAAKLRSQAKDRAIDSVDRWYALELLLRAARGLGRTSIMQEFNLSSLELTGRVGPGLLDAAAQWGNIDLVRMVLDSQRGVPPSQLRKCDSSIFKAIQAGHLHVVKILLDAEPSLLREGVTYSAVTSGPLEILEFLLSKGLNPNLFDRHGYLLFSKAVSANREDMVNTLADRVEDLAARDSVNSTALHYACEWRLPRMVKLLLKTGKFNINMRNDEGKSPLFCAINYADIVKLLLLTGPVDWTQRDRYHRTPLFLAAEHQNLEVVRMMLNVRGPGPSTKDIQSVLHYAAYRGNTAMVRLLLETGRVSAVSLNDEKTPFYMATEINRLHTVHTLLSHGITLSSDDVSFAQQIMKDSPHSPLANVLQRHVQMRKRSQSSPAKDEQKGHKLHKNC